VWLAPRGGGARRAPRPPPAVLAGVAVGLAGVAILVAGHGAGGAAGHHLTLGRIALVLASLSWVIGSLWSRALPLPKAVALASAMEMLAASPLLFLLAGLHGDFATFHPSAIPAVGWGALAYLIVFGSLAGFGSYLFLLVHEGPARTSTNAFVNPLVAVALGATVAGEPLGPRTYAAAGMIVAAVAGVIAGTSRNG
jgi:drug/metabolite transporter (DMT)-like permease